MKFKLDLFTLNLLIVIAVLVKLVFFEISFAACLAAFVILVTIQSIKVIDHLFPKRVDLYSELENLKREIDELKAKNERLESITTGLQFGMKR